MPRTKIFKELVFKKKYKSYHEFHYENKEKIYKSIVELFSEFQIVRNKTLSITISAKIENIEDYETCSTIISLSNNLTK